MNENRMKLEEMKQIPIKQLTKNKTQQDSGKLIQVDLFNRTQINSGRFA